MKFKVKNFGPIKKLDIDISPLTVIIGKNNLGKSYLAQLYYTLMDSSGKITPSYYYARAIRYGVEEKEYVYFTPYEIGEEKILGLSRQIKAENLRNDEIVERIVEHLLDQYSIRIQRVLQSSLERSFGVKVNKLVSITSNSASIKWDFFENLSLNVKITKRGYVRAKINPLHRGREIIRNFQKSNLINQMRRARTRKLYYIARLYETIERDLMTSTEEHGERLALQKIRFPPEAYYIPAGRGGLVESYETVVVGLVSLSPVAPVRGLSMPPLPGMASQFYTVLLRLRGDKGPMSNLISATFRELLEGDIQLRKMKGQAKSRLIYRFSSEKETASTDVIHAASMIKELAPIYLIVQELIKPGDFLIIEEPESHLHPGAQLKFVDIIAKLVQNKVNVFLTTHSDIFLRAVGHLLGKDRIGKAETSLSRKDIAIYWLKEGRGGCTSEKLKISDHGAIEEIPTFDDIVKELYEEEVKLEERMSKEG